MGKGTFCFCLWVFWGEEGREEARNNYSQWVFIRIPMYLEVFLAFLGAVGGAMTLLHWHLCCVGSWLSLPSDIWFRMAVRTYFLSISVRLHPTLFWVPSVHSLRDMKDLVLLKAELIKCYLKVWGNHLAPPDCYFWVSDSTIFLFTWPFLNFKILNNKIFWIFRKVKGRKNPNILST